MPLSVLFCGAATSQIVNNQVHLGDVFTEQTMDVVDVSDTISMTSAAMGNGASASNASGSAMSFTSTQQLQGQVQSTAVLNAAGTMGQRTIVSTSATGNSVDNGMNRGALTAVVNQYVGSGVLARGQVEADQGGAVDLNQNTQAVANSYNLGLTNASAGVRLLQTSDGDTMADGGAIVGASYAKGLISAQAAANNASMTGVSGSAFRTVADQNSRGGLVQASKFGAYGESYVTTTAASASANNLHATNQGGLLDVTNRQNNISYVRAQAEETSAYFSAGTANAYGVGNSLMAGSLGPEVTIVNEQSNTAGGVEATAYYGGGTGYDATSTATAMGNAATGYACSECSASLKATNNQYNAADVSAVARMSTTGPIRSAIGAAASVGNNASYYVSAPSTNTQ